MQAASRLATSRKSARGIRVVLVSLVACLVLAVGWSSAAANAAASTDGPLMGIERCGVPFPSWTGPANGEHVTRGILNPYLSRASLLQPRFHRFLRYGEPPETKTQTAIFVAGRSAEDEERGRPGASVISALNPRNGDLVWRSVFSRTDPVLAMSLASDILVTLSGVDDVRASMIHAPAGQTLWHYVMPNSTGGHKTGLVDLSLIPPATVQPPPSSGVQPIAPDAIVMDRSGALVRLAGLNGHPVWIKEPLSKEDQGAEQLIPLIMHSTTKMTYVVSLVPQQRTLRLFSSSDKYSLRVHMFSTVNGVSLGDFALNNADVEMRTSSSKLNSAGNVIIIGQDAHDGPSVEPHLVWLQGDGTVRSIRLPNSAEEAKGSVPKENVLKPKTASRFASLIELRQLTVRGFLVAQTDNHRGEVLRVSSKEGKLIGQTEFEEEAMDAIYSGTIDRKGMPYINRIYFSRNQHLLNFHTLWADMYQGEGQITGFSFQYDHDLNGDVIAAPFEVSPVSDFQLITRAAFVTDSSSIRMVQGDKHQWMREEGLSHTTASIMVDLPERKLSAGAGNEAKQILQGENFLRRLQRHANELQYLPAYIQASLLSIVLEVPNLSLDSFGIGQQRRPSAAASTQDSAQKPKPTPQNRGAAPLGGVGAQKVDLPGQGQQKQAKRGGPVGLPPMNQNHRTKTTTLRKEKEDPGVAPYMAPREANRTTVDQLTRDKFGFRKLIIATSKKGKIYAIDSSNGAAVWEKSLFGFGQGEGTEVPRIDVKFLALTRPIGGSGADVGLTPAQGGNETHHAPSAQLNHKGMITVVAEVHSDGTSMTRMWEIEPLTGHFPAGKEGQTGIALFPKAPKDVFLLPLEDEHTGQAATAAVRSTDDVFLWPTTQSIAQRFAEVSKSFFYAVKSSTSTKPGIVRDVITGYSTVAAAQLRGETVWRLPLPDGEKVVSLTRASTDTVASQGKVLGNRQTLYKYLNPHLMVALTKNNDTRSASIYLIDGVRGNILHQSQLCNGNLVLRDEDGTILDPKAVLTENWLTVKFDVEVKGDDPQARYKGEHRQTRLLSVELYEPQSENENMWKWNSVFSSFGSSSKRVASGKSPHKAKQTPSTSQDSSMSLRETPVLVYAQVYVLPYRLRTFTATKTKKGISSKALILATEDGRLQVLPRRAIDPRQPVGRKPTTQEMEEYLKPYEPMLKDSGSFFLGGRRVPLPGRVHTSASQLESTSVVFVDQSLDWFMTTVAPSGSFDLLSASFNKPQLLLTIVVLTVGFFVTKPMLASKTLRRRW